MEQEQHEEPAKLEWLRAAVQEGIDAIEQGDYTELNSKQEVKNLLRRIRLDVVAELGSRQGRGS